MRAGRLRVPASLVRLNADNSAEILGDRWIGISNKEEVQEGVLPPGLRTRVNATIRAHFETGLYPGLYWRTQSALYFIDSLRDPNGRQADLVMSCTELSGRIAAYVPVSGDPIMLRVAPVWDAVYSGEFSRVVERRLVLEVARVELGRDPTPGDRITVDGRTWKVQGIMEGGDDGVVIRLAVLP
jgi:hypothetical protein